MTPDRINLWRAYVTWIARAASAVLICNGAYWCLNRVLFGLICGQPFFIMVFRTWTGIGEGSAIYHGMASLVVGVVLALASQRLSVWVIALPTDACPGCGYLRPIAGEGSDGRGTGVISTRCPECGLEGFMKTSAGSGDGDGDAAG